MAEVLRGKHKGRQARIHQFCNDWFMVEVVVQAGEEWNGEVASIVLSPHLPPAES